MLSLLCVDDFVADECVVVSHVSHIQRVRETLIAQFPLLLVIASNIKRGVVVFFGDEAVLQELVQFLHCHRFVLCLLCDYC